MLHTLEEMFLKSCSSVFSRQKMMSVFFVLAFSALIFSIGHTLARVSNPSYSLAFEILPLFFCFGLFLATGCVVCQHYHHNTYGKRTSFLTLIKSSWSNLLRNIFFSIPLLLFGVILLLLEVAIYFFMQLPLLGWVTKTFFPFIPLLLILTYFLLGFIACGFLFFSPPLLLLKKVTIEEFFSNILMRVKKNRILTVTHFFLATLPFLLLSTLIWLANQWVNQEALLVTHPIEEVLQTFFWSLPLALLFTPLLIFFFHLSFESYHHYRTLSVKQ